jgi:aminoglycoside 3-N-acetyltransferase
MKKITAESLINEIKLLGVQKGDTIFLAADLLRVGYFYEDKDQTYRKWVDILLETVGEEGTLVIPAHTKSFFRFGKDKSFIFTKDTIPDAGALSAAFFSHPNVKRSNHPTNSCLALGKNADYILEGHNENSSSYLPYSKIIELNGKNLMLGAFADKRLSPMAMHAAQELLGITRKKWSVGLFQSIYFDKNGIQKVFTKWDTGGCTGGGYKSLGHHIIENAIKFGTVGKSTAAFVDCKKSMKIFTEILQENPNLIRCDNSKCPDCYGSPFYFHPLFWFLKIKNKFFRL